MKKLHFFKLGFLIALLLGASAVFAQVIINVPGDQPTIQAAINAANPGDNILIANDTYVPGSTINVNKSLTISGISEAGVSYLE